MPALQVIKLRRDTAANWTTANPVLAAGEPGYETNTGKIKYGDGTTAWTSLAYFTVSASAPANMVTTDSTQTGLTGDKTSSGVWTASALGAVKSGPGRYVGTTTSGNVPTTGTYLQNDFVVSYTETLGPRVHVCTTGGTPGTWASLAMLTPTNMMTTDTAQDLTGLKTISRLSSGYGLVVQPADVATSGTPSVNTPSLIFRSSRYSGSAIADDIAVRAVRRSATAADQHLSVDSEIRADGIIRTPNVLGSQGFKFGPGGLTGDPLGGVIAGISAYVDAPVFAVRGISGQTAALQEWRDSSNTAVAKVTASGQIFEGANRVYSSGNPVPVAGLSATGTKDATTVLHGDNSFKVPSATVQDALKGAGAVGNGTTDDRAAFVSLGGSLAANVGIDISNRYRIGSNLTITRPLEFNSGGRIVVPTGVTITINSAIKAGIEHIFELEGTGSVVLSVQYNVERFPEWWGAVVGADCSPGFAQCIVAGSITKLQARDYVTSATMMIPAYASVVGAGYNWESEGSATRILLASASVSPIVQLGSTATPVDLNSAPADPSIEDVYITRNQVPNAGTVSVLIAWSRFARVTRVRANTSITAFRITNAVSPFITDTFAKRDTAIAAGQGTDRFVGYHIDGTGALPAAGGNASVWMTRPQTELNVTIADSTGYLVNGRFTDVFLTQPETLGTNYGIDVQGDKGGAGSGVGSNANLVIENPVVDQTKTIGIRVRDVNKWGAVQLLQPYCGPSTGDAITVSNSDGHVGILGGQMRMNVSTSGKGITFDGCRSPMVHNTHIAECTTQALVLNAVTGGQFQPVVQNSTATLSAAVQSVGDVVKCNIRPSVNGDPGKVSIGHQSLNTTNSSNFISTAAFAPGVVNTPLSHAGGSESGTIYPDAGGGAAASATYSLTSDYGSTTPSAPTTGVVVFARDRARRLMASIGPSGLDTAYQPALFSNRVGRVTAVANVATPQLDGVSIATVVGTTAGTGAGTAQVPSAASFAGALSKVRYSTLATVSTSATLRITNTPYHLSSTANKGGFFYVCRFGVGVPQAGSRGFFGFTAANTAIAPATEPSALVNSFGIGWNAAQTNMFFIANGAVSLATNHVDLGANFPKGTATNFFEVRLFSPSAGGQNVRYSITRLNDGVFAQGQFTMTSALPAIDTLLTPHAHFSNGTTAAIGSLDLQALYVETDN